MDEDGTRSCGSREGSRRSMKHDRTEEILNLIRGLRVQLDSVSSRVTEMDDDIPEMWGRGIIGESEVAPEAYGFKITATEEQGGTFTVTVLGGTAQTLGGSPHLYEDTEILGVDDGDYICVNYQNVDSQYIEFGEWDANIHAWNASTIANHYAPKELVFVLGRVGEAYSSNVRQDHKGGIVMPAISNVVDIQTQLP